MALSAISARNRRLLQIFLFIAIVYDLSCSVSGIFVSVKNEDTTEAHSTRPTPTLLRASEGDYPLVTQRLEEKILLYIVFSNFQINKMLKNVIVKKNVGCFVYINT